MKLEKRGDGAPQQEPAQEVKEKPDPKSSRRREVSVIIYTLVLFVVALALIALSYMMQQRYNTTITDMTAEHGELTSQALRNIEELQNSNNQLTKDLQAAEDELKAAEAKISQLESTLAASQNETAAAESQRDALQAELTEAQKKAEALAALTEAVSQEDPEKASEMLKSMSALAENLDGTALEYYNKLMEEAANGPENQ